MLLPSIKLNLFQEKLVASIELRGTDMPVAVRYNRKLAVDFLNLNVKNNPRFIQDSTFGQVYQACLLRDSDFSNFGSIGNVFGNINMTMLDDDKEETD